MGAIPASGDLVTVKLLSTCGGEPCINDLSFQIENPTASWSAQFVDLASDLGGVLGLLTPGAWTDGRSTAFNTYGFQVSDERPATSPMVQSALAAQGVVAEDVMPPNDSLCVTLRTDVKGRTGRGRMYLNGWPESASNGGYWEDVAQGKADLIAGALLSAYGLINEGRNYTWGVISRYEFKAKREIPAFTAISSYTVHNEVRSLRRRAIGVRISRHRTAP